MNFRFIHEFSDRLGQEVDIKPNTQKQYFNLAKKILVNIDFEDILEITPQRIEEELHKLKTKNDVSAAKRGLEYFQKYFPELRLPESMNAISRTKTNDAKREWQPMEQDKVKRKINSIRNQKLKLAYRIMLDTGMRVSEVAQIRKQDFSLDDGEITVYVEDTKGGCPATFQLIDPYLVSRLPDYLLQLEEGDKAFYSSSQMQHKAQEYGFECHDLRRSFAQTVYDELTVDVGAKAAMKETQENMRHDNRKTTKLYLEREIV